jgi:hypothetical protein
MDPVLVEEAGEGPPDGAISHDDGPVTRASPGPVLTRRHLGGLDSRRDTVLIRAPEEPVEDTLQWVDQPRQERTDRDRDDGGDDHGVTRPVSMTPIRSPTAASMKESSSIWAVDNATAKTVCRGDFRARARATRGLFIK